MEKRNISVTLEQAIEWYNSDNATLKTLALSAYSREELEPNDENIEYIERQMYHQMMIGHFNVIRKDYMKLKALAILNTLAKYYNGDWEKTAYNTGYFIAQYSLGYPKGTKVENPNVPINTIVLEDNITLYPGVVYFKRKEDAIKAISILGERVKDLF